MLKLRQPRKNLPCCEYLPAEIPAKRQITTDIFIDIIPYYIHHFMFVMAQAHDSSAK